MSELLDYLDAAERVETLCAELYGVLAERFSVTPEIKTFYVQLQGEERKHAARVRLLRKEYEAEPARFSDPGLDSLRLERLVGRLDDLLAELSEPDAEVELGTALDLSWQLEADLASAHAEAIAQLTNPRLRALFMLLAEADRGHIEFAAQMQGRSREAG